MLTLVHIDATVTGGVLRGTRADGVAVFRGVPYASLPQRFGAPAPAPGWDGVRAALAHGQPPPQSGGFGLVRDTGAGEDWLTLAVWSADLDGRAPVIVWIPGGAYLFGGCALPEYDGVHLAREGVVLVTLNYRVGLEGFGLVEGTPPNRGLLDLVTALTWVRENIAAFGGDRGNVTVMGQSAGAGCVAALLAMPSAAGLFHRAIAQSVPGAFLTPALAADVTRECAAQLGVEPEALPTLDPWSLPAATDAVLAGLPGYVDRWGPPAAAGVVLAPVVDGDVLPTTPWEGLTGEVALLVGHTRHEQRLLSLITGVLGQVSAELALAVAHTLGPDPAAYQAAFPDPEELFEVVLSDWLFRMPSLHLALAQLLAGGSAHLYELAWPAPGLGGVLGACHGLDVPLVFGNLTAGGPAALIGPPGPEAIELSRAMRRSWTAFAAGGDPGWPDHKTGLVQVFDAESHVATYPEPVSRDIWVRPPGVLDLVSGAGVRFSL